MHHCEDAVMMFYEMQVTNQYFLLVGPSDWLSVLYHKILKENISHIHIYNTFICKEYSMECIVCQFFVYSKMITSLAISSFVCRARGFNHRFIKVLSRIHSTEQNFSLLNHCLTVTTVSCTGVIDNE